MEIEELQSPKRTQTKKLYRLPQIISQSVERFFYILGLKIAKRPRKWILCCTGLIILCIGGIFKFRQEKNPLKLWVPPDSDFVRDTNWLTSTFREGQRIENLIFTADDVLEPKALIRLNEVVERIVKIQTNTLPNISWTDVCFKVPIISDVNGLKRRRRQMDNNLLKEKTKTKNQVEYDPVVHFPSSLVCSVINSMPKGCTLHSILDIWKYNSTLIESQTKEEIVKKFNSISISPTLGHPYNFNQLVGDIKKDNNEKIISAKVVKTQFVVYINFTKLNMDEIGNDAGTADWSTKEVHDWEAAFINELENITIDLKQKSLEDNITYAIYYETGRSYGDISQKSIFHDIDKLIIGAIIMSIYVQILLSKFNWIEWRFWLTSVALFCIVGAFAVAVGLCSLFGVPYGPVHTSLPFMLMGLGVDDAFVMMAAWDEISSDQRNFKKPLPEKIAKTLSHAGAAISVTSLTDVMAFIIGASTILPSLQSFCIYAAVGVLATFFLQVTIFLAYFTIDCERVENKRNGVLPCIKHNKTVSNPKNVEHSISWKLIDVLYTKFVFTLPGKCIILTMTIVFAYFGALGSLQLEQWFDPAWFLPQESYLSQYLVVKQKGFPKVGWEATAFMSDIDFSQEFPKILNLSMTLDNATFIDNVKNWPVDFVQFLDINFQIDAANKTLDDEDFRYYISKFLFSRTGGRYQRNFHFVEPPVCGDPVPALKTTSIEFTYTHFSSPHEWIGAMDAAKAIAAEAGFSKDSYVTVWSEAFASWVTDKVISQEVVRNLVLALICVMGMTALIIAEPQTVLWILLCVLLTLLDVCGFMYFWGLTIDIVSCIGLELAVGLSVDYAAHVAHSFLNSPPTPNAENRRVERTSRALRSMKHIGAAVLFGAGSTLLALSLLSTSEAYVFRTFFKIFLLVIFFGLWHGLLMLPVVLSTVGPRSLKKEDYEDSNNEEGNEVAVPLNKI